jgi:hypothetical protein
MEIGIIIVILSRNYFYLVIEMKRTIILPAFFLLFIAGTLTEVTSQSATTTGTANNLDKQYEEMITGALRLQVRADSLARLANSKRRELAFSNNPAGRSILENQVLRLEHESRRTQHGADSLYFQARAIELRLISKRESSADLNFTASSGPSQDVGHNTDRRNYSEMATPGNTGANLINNRPEPDNDSAPTVQQQNPPFLMLGDKEISSHLPRRELARATELESEYERATNLMWEVADKTDEMEQLGYVLDADPPRRERRRINRRIDELAEEVFQMKIEAMEIFENVNAIRFIAASRFLDEIRAGIDDSLVIRSGLKHEEFAGEGFRQATGLRQTAADMRSDKYREGFLLRAYNEELKAFSEMETALEIYSAPRSEATGPVRGVPVGADGRFDPGLALSRARSTNSDPSPRTGVMVDFGFNLLSETPYTVSNPVPSNVVLPEGMVYSVQLGVFNSVLHPRSFGGLVPVMSERDPDSESVRYYTGVFRTVAEAEKALVEVNRQGFSDAFVVAYNNGIKMPVSRARQMEQSAVMADSVRETRLPPQAAQAGTGIAEVSQIEKATVVTYRIQLGALSRQAESGVLNGWQEIAGVKKVDYTVNNRGLYIYSTGNFNTFDEAARLRDTFREHGVPDAFIIPYRGDLRISIEEAVRIDGK